MLVGSHSDADDSIMTSASLAFWGGNRPKTDGDADQTALLSASVKERQRSVCRAAL